MKANHVKSLKVQGFFVLFLPSILAYAAGILIAIGYAGYSLYFLLYAVPFGFVGGINTAINFFVPVGEDKKGGGYGLLIGYAFLTAINLALGWLFFLLLLGNNFWSRYMDLASLMDDAETALIQNSTNIEQLTICCSSLTKAAKEYANLGGLGKKSKELAQQLIKKIRSLEEAQG